MARQIDHVLERYVAASPNDLTQLTSASHSVAVFTFDDGLANNFQVAAPLLEARGLTGVFCVVAAFPDVPPDRQAAWFRTHVRPASDAEHLDDPDLRSLTWDEIRELIARGHQIACHSYTHCVIDANTPREVLVREILGARDALRARLPGVPIEGFCWPVNFDEQAIVAEDIVRANYQYALCGGSMPLFRGYDPFRIHRTNIEASWPLEVIDLQFSGAIDAKFLASRLSIRLRSTQRS